MTATLTSRGQLTIPVAVRKRLGLRTGTRVSFAVFGEAKPSTQYDDTLEPTLPVTALKGLFPKPEKAVTLEEMDEAISQGREKSWEW